MTTTYGLVGFAIDDRGGMGRGVVAFAPPTTSTSTSTTSTSHRLGGRNIIAPTTPPPRRRGSRVIGIARPSSRVDDALAIRSPPSPPPLPPPELRPPSSADALRDVQFRTSLRILLPSLLSSVVSFVIFPPLSLALSYLINDAATFAVLSVDSSQFVQNFLTVTGLTFSILVGQTYYFMYQQQEAVYISLYREVAEAKSLLEQVSLVCRGRRDMYVMCLNAMRRCVRVFFSSCLV
jgi:hypothetical protein